jgi:hypothetical protein
VSAAADSCLNSILLSKYAQIFQFIRNTEKKAMDIMKNELFIQKLTKVDLLKLIYEFEVSTKNQIIVFINKFLYNGFREDYFDLLVSTRL